MVAISKDASLNSMSQFLFTLFHIALLTPIQQRGALVVVRWLRRRAHGPAKAQPRGDKYMYA